MANTQGPRLCIPRVFPDIEEDFIRTCFDQVNLGRLVHMKLVPIYRFTDQDKELLYNRVFVTLEWNDTDHAVRARQVALDGREFKIMYREPWFWKVSAARPTSAPVRVIVPRPAARAVLLDLDEAPSATQLRDIQLRYGSGGGPYRRRESDKNNNKRIRRPTPRPPSTDDDAPKKVCFDLIGTLTEASLAKSKTATTENEKDKDEDEEQDEELSEIHRELGFIPIDDGK